MLKNEIRILSGYKDNEIIVKITIFVIVLLENCAILTLLFNNKYGIPYFVNDSFIIFFHLK